MDIFGQIRNIPIPDILDKLGIIYKKSGNELELYDNGVLTSGWKANPEKGMITAFTISRPQGDRFAFVQSFLNYDKKETIDWFVRSFGLQHDEKKPFVKQRKRSSFIADMPNDNTVNILRRYMKYRGIPLNNIERIAVELGSHEDLYIQEGVYKDTLLFPMYDENKTRVGMKMRTVDGTLFNDMKSGNISGGHSGLLYNADDLEDTVYIVEGEVDYITMKAIGIFSVVGNLGGCTANKDKLKKVCKNAKRIIVCYDNDTAGHTASQSLDFGRDYEIMDYPKNTEGCDITDLINRGFSKKDIIPKPPEQPLFLGRFFRDSRTLKYYDIIGKRYVNKTDIAEEVLSVTGESKKLNDIIPPAYKGICFRQGGEDGYYNMYNENTVLTPSGNPVLNEDIGFLIRNICGEKEENIKWLMEAILHKYMNPNNVRVPAVLFYGNQGTGKTLFINLLAQIFGPEKVEFGMNQDSIDSRFLPDLDHRLIVEIKETNSTNTEKGINGMNRLKSMIFEENIRKEKKGIDSVTIKHIAWYILSSNNPRALVLDGKNKGDRRFSIIKTTGNRIQPILGKKIENSIKKYSADFLAYLIKNYEYKEEVEELDNEEKRDMQLLSETIGNRFFSWFEEKFPNKTKLTNHERNELFPQFEMEIGEQFFFENNFWSNFNKGLSPKYTYKAINVDGKIFNGYYITK